MEGVVHRRPRRARRPAERRHLRERRRAAVARRAVGAARLRRHRFSRQRRAAAARVGRRRVELRELAARLVAREGGAPLPVVVVVAVRRVGVRALEAGAAEVAVAAERGARRRERIHRLAAHSNGRLGRRRRAGERDREAGERFEQRGGRLVVVKRRLLQPVERRVVAGRPEVGAEVAPVPRLAPLAWRRVVVRARLPPLARLALAARVGRRLRHRREVAAVPRFASLARRVGRRVLRPRLASLAVRRCRCRRVRLGHRVGQVARLGLAAAVARARARGGDSWV